MSRVLATDEAQQRIAHMKTVIDGGLLDAVNQLHASGARLSDPSVWDGIHAASFRELWATMDTSLANAKQHLDELHRRIDLITTDILRAGGS